MSVVRVESEINRAAIVTAPAGHPVGDVEIWYSHDGTLRVEIARDEIPLAVRRIEFPPGGGLDVLIGRS